MILVDKLHPWSFRGRTQRFCHMTSDESLGELHEFAARIGLRREWFQKGNTHPHYDLMPGKREMAVALGAREVGNREMNDAFKKLREQMQGTDKLVSIICCTESRPWFMPWLAHVYNAFELAEGWRKQLVVVDSTPDGELRIEKRLRELLPPDELIYHGGCEPGCTIAEKSNVGMDLAEGELLGWLDDDDARAPVWLEWAINTLQDNDVLAVKTKVMFVNVAMQPHKVRYVPTKWWSAGLYRKRAVQEVRFLERLSNGVPNRVGQDVQWQGWVWSQVPQERQVHILCEGIGLALSHRTNIANSQGKNAPFHWKYDLERPELWTPAQWDETLAELAALRARLRYEE